MKISALVMSLACCLVTFPARAAITEAYIPGAGPVRIHFLQAGPANAGHSILFIPGWETSAWIWSAQLTHFSARGYRVIAMDPRSQGGSTVVESGNAPEDRARDIRAVIEGLKLTHLTLVGWSQGVQDVAAYIDRYGTGALERVVLVDASVSAGPGDVKANPAFVQTVLGYMATYSRDPRAYADGFMHAIISAPAPATTFAQLEAEFLRTPADIGISMQMQDMFTVDRRPALKKFDKPTLVIASAQSFELDVQKEEAAALPEGKFVAVAHAAHALFFDKPQEFNELLEHFIAGGSL
ncbi:MAG TPA: alpha/beta hydrolase [Gammaproteobacteria bacterium]|nr:alpha/beta hydrolase [Gammaproteobacteria bacterium]